MTLQGKHILVGISGGIAAYKIPFLIRLLRQEGADVKVCCTRNALEFVTELTLQTLSGHRVYSDVFAAINDHSTEHISLPDWADAMVVAPATANVLGKMANGIADDALTTTFAAMRKPVVIAPAMNTNMWESPATQKAMKELCCWENITMLDSAEGFLACGTTGKGRMVEPEEILEAIYAALTPKNLSGKKILITAGPTVEKLDPVRFISNFSTGKMGKALAKECQRRGAEVTLVFGQMSAEEMKEKAVAAFPNCDAAILCAAVADYRPANYSETKIKKIPAGISGSSQAESAKSANTNIEDNNSASKADAVLELRENPDIAKTLGQMKREGQMLVGFALETNNEETNAIGKLERKNLDAIVMNSLQDKGAGFGTDTNKVTIYTRKGDRKELPLCAKTEIASQILDYLF